MILNPENAIRSDPEVICLIRGSQSYLQSKWFGLHSYYPRLRNNLIVVNVAPISKNNLSKLIELYTQLLPESHTAYMIIHTHMRGYSTLLLPSTKLCTTRWGGGWREAGAGGRGGSRGLGRVATEYSTHAHLLASSISLVME